MNGEFTTVSLYKKDQSGNIREWNISANMYHIEIEYGVVGGEYQDDSEFISEGKGGRTRHEQMLSRINSRIEKKLDGGYVHSKEEALNSSRTINRSGLPKPMLAKVFRDHVPVDISRCIIQHKFNGFRCLITKHNGEMIAYSRNGKLFDSIDHIIDQINLCEGETIDGELYCHGESLQTIASWAKRFQPDSLKLVYKVYDFICDGDYNRRTNRMHNATATPLPCIDYAFGWNVSAEDELIQNLKQAVADGYEGLMIRDISMPYEAGKRSKGLLKLKSFGNSRHMYDDEFLVTGINESANGWAVLICATSDGKTFKVSAPGTHHAKTEVYLNQEKYIGRYVQVGYSEMTPDGKPFHPVAIQWRNKYSE